MITAEYHRPYETHARMEPINATVSVTDKRVDVWSPTQDQSVALRLAADQAGRDTRDVFVHTVFLGGGFGGGGGGNTAVTRQATEISRQLGRPVKVIWSREEDIAQDKQRPPSTSLVHRCTRRQRLAERMVLALGMVHAERRAHRRRGAIRLRDRQHAVQGSQPPSRVAHR